MTRTRRSNYRNSAYRPNRRYSTRTRATKPSSTGVYMPGTEFIAGAIAGYTDLADKHLPGELVVAAAVAPIRGARAVTQFARGVVFGNIIQARLGKSVSLGGNSVRGF